MENKYHYHHIKIRVSDDERAILEQMVADRKAKSLNDALRRLAFTKRQPTEALEAVDKLLGMLAHLHNEIVQLIHTSIEYKSLYETDIICMERLLIRFGKSALELSQAVRRMMKEWVF